MAELPRRVMPADDPLLLPLGPVVPLVNVLLPGAGEPLLVELPVELALEVPLACACWDSGPEAPGALC
jgi:hypothetical protein